MKWLCPNIVMVTVVLTTCVRADRLAKLKGQMTLMQAFQFYLKVRSDAIEGNISTLTERVSSLESHVTTLENKVEELEGRVNEDVVVTDEPRSTTKDWATIGARDCSDVLKQGLSRGSGVYKITPWNTHGEVDVYCDMDTDGGGWTVSVSRRLDGSVDFNRKFVEYKKGFGSLDGEFWMGLGLLHLMTSRAKMTLRIDTSFPEGIKGFDEYSGFHISPPDQYNFTVDRRINSRSMSESFLLTDTGKGGDMNHQPFSTFDRDVDKSQGNCVRMNEGGWWYKHCSYSNLNAPYDRAGFSYNSFEPFKRLMTSTMMLRLS